MVNKSKISIYDIALMSTLTAILFVQEQLLVHVPGVQLTIFLIVLYSKKLGLIRSLIIVIIYALLDNLYMNSFSLLFTPFMLIGWLIIPLTVCTIFRKVESSLVFGCLGILYSFLYSWLFIIPNFIFLNIGPLEYLASDILFEVILAVCSFLSLFWLYKPCSKIIDRLKK